MPCPYCVILTAIQRISGSAAIISATTLVLPTLRECPPTTITAIRSFLTLACKPRQHCEFFQVLADWPRRSSPEDYAFTANRLVGWDAALCSQDGTSFDGDVVCDANLASHHAVFTDGRTAADPSLGVERTRRADVFVVAEIQQVVELPTRTDDTIVKRAAGDGKV